LRVPEVGKLFVQLGDELAANFAMLFEAFTALEYFANLFPNL